MDALSTALTCLSASTSALEADTALLEEVGGGPDPLQPPPPETPKLLPAVAAAWPLLMEALRDGRTAAVERALRLLADVVMLSGEASHIIIISHSII